MSILKRQQAGKEIGRIRIGTSVVTDRVDKNGNALRRPVKLETFRLTTGSRTIADAAAAVFGGTVVQSERVGWDVVTAAAELPVMVPPGEVISQAWELWSGGACQRRCDGQTVTLPDKRTGPCLCPTEGPERMDLAAAGRACKPTTRLNLVLPDLPDLGVWRLESHGYYAAAELGDMAALLAAARDAGHMLPARLWLDQRSRVVGGKTHSWFVPMLSLQHTLRELSAGNPARAAMLPPEPRLAITAATVEQPEQQTTAHEQAWAGPVVVDAVPAQAIADRAHDTTAAAVIKALIVRADEQDLAAEMVTVDGADEPLGEYLAARLGDLT